VSCFLQEDQLYPGIRDNTQRLRGFALVPGFSRENDKRRGIVLIGIAEEGVSGKEVVCPGGGNRDVSLGTREGVSCGGKVKFGMKIYKLIVFIFCLSLSVSSIDARAESPEAAGFVDVHMHIDGVSVASSSAGGSQLSSRKGPMGPKRMMNQRRRAMIQQDQRQKQKKSGQEIAASVEYLISLMDAYGVEKSIIMPPP